MCPIVPFEERGSPLIYGQKKAEATGVYFCFKQDEPLQNLEELSQTTTMAEKRASAARALCVCL